MLRFLNLLLQETLMSSTGSKGFRHAKNYVSPLIGKNLEVGKNFGDIKTGTRVKVIGQHEIDDKHHTEVEHEGKKIIIPNHFFNKPEELIKRKGVRGFKAESSLVNKLKEIGLMKKDTEAAGSTGGNDFHIVKPNGDTIGGEERDNINSEIQGESKIDLGAKFGSVFLSYSPEKKWHIPERNRIKKPEFTRAVESSTVNGKPLLKHLNETWGDPSDERHLKNVSSDTTNDSPAQAYFQDHHVHVLHIHSHGTYRVGDSHLEDVHNTNLPSISGMSGRFTVGRERARGGVQISFRPHKKSLQKSSTDIMRDDDALRLKENIEKNRARGITNIGKIEQEAGSQIGRH